MTQGWARAFHYGNSTAKFDGLQHYVRQTLRRWLWRKHGRTRAQYGHYTNDRLHEHYGLWSWPLHAAWKKTGHRRNQSDEWHSESRVRENRSHGSPRGRPAYPGALLY